MPELSSQDIALGRAALQQRVITRQQLDSAVSLCRSGRANDLSRALIQTGGITPGQLQLLLGQMGGNGGGGPPPPPPPPAYDPTEANTLHDGGGAPPPSSPFASVPRGHAPQPGAFADMPTLSDGPPPPPGSPFGGSGFGSGAAGLGAFAEMPTLSDGQPPADRPFGPGGTAFGPPPIGLGGSGSAFGSPGGFGAPPSGFGGEDFSPSSGSSFGSGSFGSPAGPGGFGSGAGPGGFGSGAGPGGFGSAAGPGGFGSDAGPGGFGSAAGGFGSAAGPGGFGGAPVGTGFGAPPSGAGFGSQPGSGFGASPAPAGPAIDEEDELIGEWRVERELARGGMGVIYVGTHETTRQKAAIKVMLQTDGSVSPRKVKRFLREIETASKLIHPGIVRILDSGQFRGYPYFAMEYVEGKPLDRMLKDDLDLEIGMEVIEAVARAAGYAHEQGVIHRDLKPANVIVQEDMKPKLTDFGLAKNKDHQSVLTKTGAVLGTPYYLSPEQAQGRSKDIDARADIYSLGVIMYELATGRLPFVGQTTVELYNRIIHDDPVPPTKIKPQLTKALETVCLKAMAKSPLDRYPTAEEFADDINALLSGGQIAAKPDGPIKRFLKRLKKKGAIPAVLGTTVVLLGLVVGGLVWHHKNQEKLRHAKVVQQEVDSVTRAYNDALDTLEKELNDGQLALRNRRVPDALKATQDGLGSLAALEERVKQVKLPESKAPLEKLIADNAGRRARAHAATLVLRARATMSQDERGNLESAEKDLATVLNEKEGVRPGDPQALAAQGDLFALRGDLDDALMQYKLALERSPNSVSALLGKAQALILKEDFEEAVSDVTAALKYLDGKTPKAPEVPEGEEAPKIEFEEIPEDAKQDLAGQLLIQRAHARLELGRDLDKALADAKAAQDKLPKSWEPLAMIGWVLARKGHAFEARDAYGQATALAPEQAGAYIARAEGLLELGYGEQALADARNAVSLDPSSLLALVVRAEAETLLLEFEAANRDAEDVANTARDRRRHWRVAGRAERVLATLNAIEDNIPDAHDHAKKAVTLDDFSSANKLIQARIELDSYFEGQYLDSAERLLKKVAKKRPDSLEATRGLGLVLLMKLVGQPDRAQRQLDAAQDMDPQDPQTLVALARTYQQRAKKGDAQAARHEEMAAKNFRKALRFERDLRRPEGQAYALGLRNQLLGERLRVKQQAESWAKAQKAYRQAIWLDPTHVHAHTGLAAIAHLQGAFQRTGTHLARAANANEEAILPSVLLAFHLATPEGVEKDVKLAEKALEKARKLRGDTLELSLAGVFLNALKGDQELDARLKGISEGYKALRKQDPFNEEIYRREEKLLSRLADRLRVRGLEPRRKIKAQLSAVGDELSKLRDEIADRELAAKGLRKKTELLLKGKDDLAPLDPADRATRLAPWDSSGWWLLAKAREKSGELWGALAAGVRAAYLDSRYVGRLFTLLRRAGTELPDDSPEEVAEYLMLDREVLPFPPDLERFLQSVPLVARALVTDLKRDEALKLFAELEESLNHDPTCLLAHALLGALAFGVKRDVYAMQHLLLIATVREDLGQAFYLAAVAAAREGNGRNRRLDVLAIESLKKATQAKFDWKALAEKEKALAPLRASPLWKRLSEN